MLKKGWWLTSPKEKCSLLMEKNGDLVLYLSNDRELIWDTKSYQQGEELVMLDDGNLVLYDINKKKLFSTFTSSEGEYLMVQDDRDIVIYGKKKEKKWSLKKIICIRFFIFSSFLYRRIIFESIAL